MRMSLSSPPPVMSATASVSVPGSSPLALYALVSDLPRQAEWSPECRGGRWISGEPRTVGAVFEGENHRDSDVVAWAPVVRGEWRTHCEVVTADPGRRFAWAMLTRSGETQESVWSFDIEPGGSEVILQHAFVMTSPTEGIEQITAEMSPAAKRRFFLEWEAKVADDLERTIARIAQIASAVNSFDLSSDSTR